MDKIKQLQQRKAVLKAAGESIREGIEALCDEKSFVELSSFSFSKGECYGKDIGGEGVVTGFATLQGYPFYIVAQNFAEQYGALTKENCDKIVKTLDAAEKNDKPVIYLLNSQGVKVGEGTEVLEGIAKLLLRASQLKGSVPQYAIIAGEVYGSAAALAAICDFVFFLKDGVLSVTSPYVLSAKAGKNLSKDAVGGYAALKNAGLPAISVESLKDASRVIAAIGELLAIPMIDAELNEAAPALNETITADAVAALIEGAVEFGANSSPEVKTLLGRIGGISVAAVVFDDVRLNERNVKKIRDFAEFAACYDLPFVTFVDCGGMESSLAVNDSAVLGRIAEYLTALDTIAASAKIAVVTGKAIGIGYSLFAAKSARFDYSIALANARIAPFEDAAGAAIVYGKDRAADGIDLAALYGEEHADPVNAAKGGYLDDVVEPQFVKQYLIASLQMLLR